MADGWGNCVRTFKLRIGAEEVEIRPCNMEKAGLAWPTKNLIEIDPSATPMAALHALIHEVRHIHHHQTGMNDVLEDQAQELDCASTSGLFIQLLGQVEILHAILRELDKIRKD